MSHFDWGRFENQLFALYVRPVNALAPLPEPEDGGALASLTRLLGLARRAPRLYAIALHGFSRDRGGALPLPRLSANTDEREQDYRRLLDRWGLDRWEFHDVEIDARQKTELSAALDEEARRDNGKYWVDTQARYLDCLVKVAARLETEARRVAGVTDDFVVVVLDGSNHDVTRRSIGDRRFEALFPKWAERRAREAPATTTPPSRLTPPPAASPELRRRWRRVRRALRSEGESKLAQKIAVEAGLGEDLEPMVAVVLRALLSERSDASALSNEAIDDTIAAIDRGLDTLLNAILHSPAQQALEATWRSLAYLTEQLDFGENIQLWVLNATKEDIALDLGRSTSLVRSALHRQVYRDAYISSERRAEPFAVVVGLYDFGPSEEDIQLLEDIGTVAMGAQSVFLASAATSMFGHQFGDAGWLDDALSGSRSLFDEAMYARWRAFREAEASRYVGLSGVRFRARLPYEIEGARLAFREHVDGTALGPPWASSTVLLVARIADAFAKYRLTANFIGRGDGAIRALPGRPVGAARTRRAPEPWCEADLTSWIEYRLSELGFIGWLDTKPEGPHFPAANSCHAPRVYENTPEAKHRETNYRLGTQLPYQLFATRFAQYLKVVRLECFPTLHDRVELERALSTWLDDLVDPTGTQPTERPLREARLVLEDLVLEDLVLEDMEHERRWFRFHLELAPHFKYMGAELSLSLSGRIER